MLVPLLHGVFKRGRNLTVTLGYEGPKGKSRAASSL